eukprot:Sdes_comp22884_c0_seq1m21258
MGIFAQEQISKYSCQDSKNPKNQECSSSYTTLKPISAPTSHRASHDSNALAETFDLIFHTPSFESPLESQSLPLDGISHPRVASKSSAEGKEPACNFGVDESALHSQPSAPRLSFDSDEMDELRPVWQRIRRAVLCKPKYEPKLTLSAMPPIQPPPIKSVTLNEAAKNKASSVAAAVRYVASSHCDPCDDF